MADYIVNKGIQGRPSVNLQSTSLVGPQGPVGPAGGYWISNVSGIHTLSNVGIGTDNPIQSLEVLGQCRFNGDVNIDGESELYFGNGNLTFSSNNGQSSILTSDYLLFIDSGSVDLKTNGSTAVGITSIGFVGIGTTNPTAKLDVLGNVNISGMITSRSKIDVKDNNYTTEIYPTLIRTTNITAYNNINSQGSSWIDGGALFGPRGISNPGYPLITGLKAPVAITSTGNISAIGNIICDGYIGIGTTNPTAKLDVRGDIKSGIDTSTGLVLTSPNGTEYRLIVDDLGNLSTISI